MTSTDPEDGEVERTASSEAALELDRVRRMIAGLTVTDVGRKRLTEIGPVRGEVLDLRRARLVETEGLLDDGALVPSPDGPLADLVAALDARQPELPGPVLLRWMDVLRTVRDAVERITASEEATQLGALVEDLADLGWLEERIASTLDRRGRVRDDASPELRRLRARIGKLRKTTYSILESTLQERGDLFAEDTVPLHEGRLVVMLKSGERGSIDVLVHGRSSSGRNLYFEPLAAVEANNALREALDDEEAERRRLLRELVDAVVGHRDEIAAQVEVLAELDCLQAAGRFAELTRGRLLEISDGDLVLRETRHPLLAPETRDLRRRTLGDAGHAGEVTPLDLEIVGGERLLVVTGPNAGGKTVALKTAGLAGVLTACGLPVPAASGSRVPVPRRLVAAVGDEQDLMRDRSTFSGRLLRLQEAWEAAGPDALVLVDELGSGTDPEEGSALAVALIERLVDEGTTSIVTTHLVAVASTALDRPGAACAAMEFDRETGRPTFRLIPGPPGGSEAIALGQQLGLAPAWLARARDLVGEEHGKLTRLLAEVESLRAELEGEREALESAREDLEEERAAVATERERLAERRRKLAATTEREVESFRRRVRQEMEEEVERLREELEKGRRRGLAAAAVERMFSDAPEIETPGD
ncbi:MAG: hypothetical protein R3244_01105, partial [Thermoanaerobaculia bacterium]|nr:hypothetical protein [Thermoanaerobaculia bacterium]